MREVWVIAMYRSNACFRFEIEKGKIVWSADYGRRFLLGKTLAEAELFGECTLIALK